MERERKREETNFTMTNRGLKKAPKHHLQNVN